MIILKKNETVKISLVFLRFLGTSLIEADLQKEKEKARFCLFINHWDFHPHFTSVSHIDMILLFWHCKMYHINKYTQYKPSVFRSRCSILVFKPMVKNTNGSFFIPKQ